MAQDTDRAAGADRGPVPTSDALRHRTDVGASGDKVPFPDPAMAPLGTDDEAAGHPPTLRERAMAAEHEQPSPAVAERAGDKPDHSGEGWAGPLMIAAGVLSAVVIASTYWFVR